MVSSDSIRSLDLFEISQIFVNYSVRGEVIIKLIRLYTNKFDCIKVGSVCIQTSTSLMQTWLSLYQPFNYLDYLFVTHAHQCNSIGI